MPLNTRSKKRASIEAVVEFSINDSVEQAVKLNIPKDSIKLEANKSVKSTLFDISASGCAIASPYIIPPGVILNIKIDAAAFKTTGIPDRKEALEFVGKVKSCIMKAAGQYRLGIQFQNPKKEDIDFINAFINTKERRKDTRWDMTGRE